METPVATPEIQTSNNLPTPQKNDKFYMALGSLVLLSCLLFVIYLFKNFSFFLPKPKPSASPTQESLLTFKKFEKFASEEEFVNYLKNTEGQTGMANIGMQTFGGEVALREAVTSDLGMTKEGMGAPSAITQEAGRVSETNVQVIGIDEPDIVKTDAKQIYYSDNSPRVLYEQSVRCVGGEDCIIPPQPTSETKIIKAFPPEDLEKLANIEKTGDLLLYHNKLILFSFDEIVGFEVSDPTTPKQAWQLSLKSKLNSQNSEVVTARLYSGKLYLVTRTYLNRNRPCPIEPLYVNDQPFSISCMEIYHPVPEVYSDSLYTVMVLDPETGKIQDKISFVGQTSNSVVYMSKNSLYVTYPFSPDVVAFFYDFLNTKGKTLFPANVLARVKKLKDYEISQQAKMTELSTIMQEYQNSLSDDERLKVENELNNKMSDYYKEKRRTLERTGLVKINLDNFSLGARGEVAGRLLNQFSLDEYDNYLRIATTVGGTNWNTQDSANDVYVLDKNLKITGSVEDLGLEEKIYSVRFIEDKGYLVTFKQVDPFFVLDLSNPKLPKVKGQLKIPGYSAYLHPIDKDKILGIGKEGNGVKISLFGVSDPENPQEIDKYLLTDYYSDILETHHAFLLDKSHQIFFVPGSEGGYIFSYKNDKLELVRTVAGFGVKRALYLDDYLYILGEQSLVVLNENTWVQVNELSF